RWPADIMDAAALDAIDEAVDHPLAARLVEVDRQLVAINLGNVAIAELLVKDALALLERRGLTSRGGDQLTLDHQRSALRLVPLAPALLRALPAGRLVIGLEAPAGVVEAAASIRIGEAVEAGVGPAEPARRLHDVHVLGRQLI